MNIQAGIQYLGVCGAQILIAILFSAFMPMKRERKNIYLCISLGILAFLTMFRDATVGTDTREYVKLFRYVSKFENPFHILTTRYEIGYVWLNWGLSRISTNPQILLIAVGGFTYLTLYRYIKKWVKSPGLVVVLLVTTLTFDFYISAMRQTLATMMLLFAYEAVYYKKKVKFMAFVLLAASFHQSALVFFLAYPLVNCDDSGIRTSLISFEATVVFSAVVGLVALKPILDRILSLFPVYSYYFDSTYVDGNVRLSTVLNIVIASLMFAVPHWTMPISDEIDTRQLKMNYRYFVVYAVILVVSIRATLLARFASLFEIFGFLYYVERVEASKDQKNAVQIVIVTLILFALYGFVITILRTPVWQMTYPYKFCF